VPCRTVLLDTSYILALENKDDLHHERAKALDRELLKEDAILLLHWGILFEIADGYARVGRRAEDCNCSRNSKVSRDIFSALSQCPSFRRP
jgi:predicted nucleic acid-binding protein